MIFKASKQYAEKYRNRYGFLKLLGMQQAMSVESVSLEVRFLDEQSIRRFDFPEGLEKAYREGQRQKLYPRKIPQKLSQVSPPHNAINNAEPIVRNDNGITAANENQYLMVLGGVGSGKTTFLCQVGLEALKGEKGRFQHSCIPVFLELKRLAASEVNLVKNIVEEFQNFGFLSSDKFVINALKQGKLLVLIDGLDEVPKRQMTAVIKAIQDFVTQYNQNRFITSCRIAVYQNNLPNFRECELSELNDMQIQQFIDNWFQSDLDRRSETDKKCWEILNQPNNSSAKELARIPLLLALLCLVYNRHLSFPNKQGTLYRTALDILLREWVAEKRVEPNKIYQRLNIDLEKILLSEIAYQGFEKDQLFFRQSELVQKIENFLADTADKPKYLDGEAVLSVVTQQGVLVEQAQSIYSFTHKTLQEYLTAQYIVDNNQIEQLVIQHFADLRWQEVFLLVAGLMRGRNGADKLLLLMEKEVQQYIDTPRWRNLLHWADQATSGAGCEFNPAAKRAAAIFFAFILAIDSNLTRSLTHALASTLALASIRRGSRALSFVRDLALNIDHALDLKLSNTVEQAFDLAHELTGAIDYATGLNPDLVRELDRTIILILKRTVGRDIELELNLAHQLAKLKIFSDADWTTLVNELKALEGKVSARTTSDKKRQVFREHLAQVWCSALHLDPKLAKLSRDEIKALANYLDANRLILRCKESAVRVSAKNWEGIETRMLMVPEY